MARLTALVYGKDGHRQRESFNDSHIYNFSDDQDGTRIIEVQNADKTGTNDYTKLIITRDSIADCHDELDGQILDGIFENSATGRIEIVSEEPYCRLAERIRDTLYDMASIDDCPTIDEVQDGLKSPTESAYLLESLMDLYTADPDDEATKQVIYDLIQHMEGRY